MKRLLIALALVLVTVSTPRATAQTLYAATGAGGVPGNLYTINPATAAATLVGPTTIGLAPIGLTGLAFHPTTGVLYGVTPNGTFGGATNPNSFVTINPATGAATLIGVLTSQVGDIGFDSAGTLYGWQTAVPSFLVTINLTTAVETQRGTTGLLSSIGNGLSFVTGTLYLAPNGTNPAFIPPGALFTVDPASGNTTVGPTLSGAPHQVGGAIAALTVDPGGILFGVNNTNAGGGGGVTTCNLVVIDPATGVVTDHGLLPNNTDALAFTNAGIAAPPGSYTAVTPCRMLDTRTTTPIPAGGTRTATLTGGACGIAAAANAVSLNLTVTGVASQGHLVLYAADQAAPATSNIEFRTGRTRANNAIVQLATDGSGTINILNVSAGALDVVLDVNGFFK
jgi:hypothetical protein